YSGEVGRSISKAVNGAITASDLERPQAEWVEPLSLDLFGGTGWTVPPNSQGYISLLALAIIQRHGLPAPDDPVGWHQAIEAYRLATADRDELLADPESMAIPPSSLLSSRRIESLADRYSPTRRAELPPAGRGSGGTAYMCVIDDAGMGVSLIQSNFHGIGSGLVVPEGGFILHDRGRGFTLLPGHPNELAPGRRPLHTLSPTLWTTDGRLSGLLGTRGGFMQPQLVVQLSAAIVGHHAGPERAMSAPRWMVPLPGTHDETVEIEPGVSEAVPDTLRQRGHKVTRRDTPQGGWGPMSTIQISEIGLRTGAADPRVDTAAAAAR
ncbi:MAG: gamma-glutamyltransferase, partial [Actinomycetota bacterium]